MHTPKNVPIIIPCSHRPEFLEKCLDKLKNCDRIDEFSVYFSFDNPEEGEGDIGDYDGVYLLCKEWEESNISNETFIFERKDIWHGNINSAGAIGYVMKKIGSTGGFIYIEEDVVVSRCFLNFSLDTLNFYNENKYVMMIAGHNNRKKEEGIILPTSVKLKNIYSCSVLLGMISWWNRWEWIDENLENFSSNPLSIKNDLYKSTIFPEINCHVNKDGRMKMLDGGGLFTACMIKDGRICLVPDNDLVDHIGWYGWHMPKQQSNPNNFTAKSETFHEDNQYDNNFPLITKKDVAECFNIDVNRFIDSRDL